MSGLTHRVKPLPPGTTPEKALADALAALVEDIEHVTDWQSCVQQQGRASKHIGTDKTYGEMLDYFKDKLDTDLLDAIDVLFSVGRYYNPPM